MRLVKNNNNNNNNNSNDIQNTEITIGGAVSGKAHMLYVVKL